MSLRIRDVTLALGELDSDLTDRAARRLGVPPGDVLGVRVARKSVDARKRPPRWVVQLDVELRDETAVAGRLGGDPGVGPAPPTLPPFHPAARRGGPRPIVVGTGPAGLFAVLTLLERGVVPLVLERGRPVDRRVRDVARFFRRGELDPESNVQFGMGGAGTFSDGKLVTRRNDPAVRLVLERLVEFGAPPSILVDAKPHVGTDRLRDVLRNLTARFAEEGVEVRFDTRVTDFEVCAERLEAIRTADGERHRAPAVVLATGHSARDVYRALHRAGVPLEAKAFAVGLRVEHPQTTIDRACYGRPRAEVAAELPAADYRLTAEVDGRGVYSFCMCPGGRILASSSEPGGVVTNGMSAHARASPRANAAVVAAVEPHELGMGGAGAQAGGDPLVGLRFQRHWEERAFALGGADYRAPAQTVADFLAGRVGRGDLSASYRPGVVPADLAGCLPTFVLEPLRQGLRRFERSLPGFSSGDAVLVGVETRTSAPVRILRDGSGQSPGAAGLFPAGEGAGWAGGIVTSAVDGIRSATRVLEALGLS